MKRADFYSRFGAGVSSTKYAGSLIYLMSPAKTDKRTDLTVSSEAYAFSFGCYELAIPDQSVITLVVNNVSPSASERTFLGVQIIQLQGHAGSSRVDIEISREAPFARGDKPLEPLPPTVLPLSLDEWNAIHSTSDIGLNDSALGAAWHGHPLESRDNSWNFRSCWKLTLGNDCWDQNVAERIQGRHVLIQNRLFSFTPAPLNSFGKGVAFEVVKRSSTERIIVRYHSPSTPQKGELELCFRNCR
jgi:hypothetical protein